MQYAHILFIDDDEDDLDLFTEAVRRLPVVIQTETFQDASTALATLDAGKTHPDLIFIDLNMPVLNGQEFLRTIKAHEVLRDIPVIVLSTTDDPDTVTHVKALGAVNY